jgi:hypothetical protein
MFLGKNDHSDVHFIRPSAFIIWMTSSICFYPANAVLLADGFILRPYAVKLRSHRRELCLHHIRMDAEFYFFILFRLCGRGLCLRRCRIFIYLFILFFPIRVDVDVEFFISFILFFSFYFIFSSTQTLPASVPTGPASMWMQLASARTCLGPCERGDLSKR